jgi:putative ABC transport system permease protein
MNTILIALRYLRTRKLRTLLTTLAIVFGVAVIFGSNTMVLSLQETLENAVTPPGEPDVRFTRTSGESFAPQGVLETAANIEGVHAVTGVFRRSFIMPIPGMAEDERPTIQLIGVDPQTATQVNQYPIREGRFLEVGESHVVVIPASLADLAELAVGDTLPLFTPGGIQRFTIVGLLDDSGVPSMQFIVPLADVQSTFRAEGQITAVEINFAAGADREAVTQRILVALGSGFAVEENTSLVNLDLGFASLNFFGMMALFVGAFLIFTTFRTAVTERQYDLSVLRAIGAERGQVIRFIVIESLVQGFAGTLLGLPLGWGFAYLLISWTEANGQSISGGLPADLQMYFSLPSLLVAAAAGILTTLLASYFPARTAGRVSPLAALRPQTSETLRKTARWHLFIGIALTALALVMVFGGDDTLIAGGFVALLAAVFLAPVLLLPGARFFSLFVKRLFPREGDIAQGNLLRQPGRSAVVVNTLMVGFAVFVASAALVASMSQFFVSMYADNYAGDLMLLPVGRETGFALQNYIGADNELLERLRALPEVAAVTSLRHMTTTYQNQALNLLGIDPAYAGELRPLLLYEGDLETVRAALSSGRAVVITYALATDYHLGIGDILELDTPLSGVQRYTIVGIGNDVSIASDKPAVLLSQANLLQDFGGSEEAVLYIAVAEQTSIETARAAVETVLSDYPQMIVVNVQQFREDGIQEGLTLASFFYAMAVVVVIPSLLGLLNTLAINVMERKREIGMIRAVGGSQEQIQGIILAESCVLGLLGAVMGILVGLALGAGFTQLWDAALHTPDGMPTVIPYGGIVFGLVAGLLLTLFITLFPARHAAHQDIVTALRYE